MADPVTILTDSGPVVLARVTALWIYEQIAGDDGLGKTREALDECLRGKRVALPDTERKAFCERLSAVLAGMSPSQLSSLETQEARHLLSALGD
jgi:hypothetical protein